MIHYNNCKIIGITGGIGTGKTTVSETLIENGYTVINADEISHKIIEKNSPSYKLIVKYFGEKILLENKEINRKKLGSIVFKDTNKLDKLNEFTHPYIYDEIKRKINNTCIDNQVIFLEIPLLFETIDIIKEKNINIHEIWLVDSDKDKQIERIMERNNFSKLEAVERISSQMDMKDKRKKATKIIKNNSTKLDLKKEVKRLLYSL